MTNPHTALAAIAACMDIDARKEKESGRHRCAERLSHYAAAIRLELRTLAQPEGGEAGDGGKMAEAAENFRKGWEAAMADKHPAKAGGDVGELYAMLKGRFVDFPALDTDASTVAESMYWAIGEFVERLHRRWCGPALAPSAVADIPKCPNHPSQPYPPLCNYGCQEVESPEPPSAVVPVDSSEEGK